MRDYEDLIDELLDDEPIGISILKDSAVLQGADKAPHNSIGACFCLECQATRLLMRK